MEAATPHLVLGRDIAPVSGVIEEPSPLVRIKHHLHDVQMPLAHGNIDRLCIPNLSVHEIRVTVDQSPCVIEIAIRTRAKQRPRVVAINGNSVTSVFAAPA